MLGREDGHGGAEMACRGKKVTSFTRLAVAAPEAVERMLTYHLTGKIAEGE